MDRFLHDRAVQYFNRQHPSKRVIAEGETYFLRFIFCERNAAEWPLPDTYADGDKIGQAQAEDAQYHSEATFLWVGPAGSSLIATMDDLLPVSYSPAAAASSSPITLNTITATPPNQGGTWDTMVDAEYVAMTAAVNADIETNIGAYLLPGDHGAQEIWFTNPAYAASLGGSYMFQDLLQRLYPLYSREQMVFKFPTFDAALTAQNPGMSLIFNPFVSLRRISFDDQTEAYVTYNSAHPDAFTTPDGGLIELELYYTANKESVIAPDPEDHTLILRVGFQPHSPSATSNVIVVSTEAFGQEIKRGLTGLFYWRWSSGTHSQIGTSVLPELTVTLLTKVVNDYSNNVGILMPT